MTQVLVAAGSNVEPLANLRVGIKVLQDCIRDAGTIEGGLGCYVGAVDSDASDYVAKVMAEQQRLRSVARGIRLPVNAQAMAPRQPAAGSRELEADAGDGVSGKPRRS